MVKMFDPDYFSFAVIYGEDVDLSFVVILYMHGEFDFSLVI